VTLLPSDAVAAVDCGHATQALLVRTYLERVRRPPESRLGTHPVRLLEPTDPPAIVGSPSERERPRTNPSTLSLPRLDESLLWRSFPSPATTPSAPPTVLSAIALIERRATEPIGLAEIAAAAQLSPRALQVAFRKHLGTTPLGYLREVRMSRAHADLQAARPGDGQTVSAVANRWGFSQLSRFAHDYKQRYGVSPRQTLGRSAP
jgi:transcriptional regulator GlxA family with amidase domain